MESSSDQVGGVVGGLTSTTAPGKIFGSRAELADHYKSAWHKYNLKRREAGLPPLFESDFEARLSAAQEALAQQQAVKISNSHLKNKEKKDKKQSQKRELVDDQNAVVATVSSQASAYERIKQQTQQQQQIDQSNNTGDDIVTDSNRNTATDTTSPIPGNVPANNQMPSEDNLDQVMEINPRQSLFDRHISPTVADNVARMQRKFGFFIPDAEFLIDLEGLIGYCHEKILLGRTCLYCQQVFRSSLACRQHMLSDKQHAKIRYELGIDLHEFQVFYDFSEADQEFLKHTSERNKQNGTSLLITYNEASSDQNDNKKRDSADDAEEWEDVSDQEQEPTSDELMQQDDDDDDDAEEEEEEDIYAGYEQEVAAMGLDVTPLGELIFPDGRIIGHRAFRRYYQQRTGRRDNRASVVAARQAAGDRLYRGRVVNIHDELRAVNSEEAPLALTAENGIISKSNLLAGRGKGILVLAEGSAPSSPVYTQLSLYRYRAALRKQRRDDDKGNRLLQKTAININRMDKKANRLMNGVSVAHAKR